MSRWLPASLVLLVVVWTTLPGLLAGDVRAVLVLLAGVGIAWWISPLNGRSGPRHEDLTGEDPVVIYWRPGCVYCIRLRGALGRQGRRATWVSIWADPDAAAYVRSVNGGNETVPTVLIDGEPHTNPDPELVRTALAQAS